MNVAAFPPVRSETMSGSGCGFTCHEEMVLQTDSVRAGWPLLCSSSALQARLQGLASPCLAPSLPPSSLSTHSRLQKPWKVAFFLRLCCSSTTQAWRPQTELLQRDRGVFLLLSPICDNPHLGQWWQRGDLPAEGKGAAAWAALLHSESPWCCSQTPGTSQVLGDAQLTPEQPQLWFLLVLCRMPGFVS